MAEVNTPKKYIKLNDEWTEVETLYQKVRGSWVELGSPYIKRGGEWVHEVEPTPVITVAPFNTATDEEITNIINGYYNGYLTLEEIKDVWKVGDKRSVNLSAMSATGVGESHRAQTVELQILDFNHDTLSTSINDKTKALLTLDQKDCLMDETNYNNMIATPEGELMEVSPKTENGYINSTDDNTTGWANCARRTWCNQVYYNALPQYLKSLVKEVKKVCGTTQQTDKVFLLSEQEVIGQISNSAYVEGYQYPIYQSTSNLVKRPRWKASCSENSDIWWLRSPYKTGTTYWCEIKEDLVSDMHLTTRNYGIAPAMCL